MRNVLPLLLHIIIIFWLPKSELVTWCDTAIRLTDRPTDRDPAVYLILHTGLSYRKDKDKQRDGQSKRMCVTPKTDPRTRWQWHSLFLCGSTQWLLQRRPIQRAGFVFAPPQKHLAAQPGHSQHGLQIERVISCLYKNFSLHLSARIKLANAASSAHHIWCPDVSLIYWSLHFLSGINSFFSSVPYSLMLDSFN